jgi:hypothetical protein
MQPLCAVRGLEKTSEAFRRGLCAIAADLDADPTALAAVMSFESGFDPAIKNRQSGATGLIQFMPSTARRLGTTTADLARMTAEEQLSWVHKYLRSVNAQGRLRTVADHYMAVFAPAAIGKPDTATLYSTGQAYSQNSGLDLNRDHVITKGEAAARVVALYQAALARGPLPPKEGGTGDSLAPFPAGSSSSAPGDEGALTLADLSKQLENFQDETNERLTRVDTHIAILLKQTDLTNPAHKGAARTFTNPETKGASK